MNYPSDLRDEIVNFLGEDPIVEESLKTGSDAVARILDEARQYVFSPEEVLDILSGTDELEKARAKEKALRAIKARELYNKLCHQNSVGARK